MWLGQGIAFLQQPCRLMQSSVPVVPGYLLASAQRNRLYNLQSPPYVGNSASLKPQSGVGVILPCPLIPMVQALQQWIWLWMELLLCGLPKCQKGHKRQITEGKTSNNGLTSWRFSVAHIRDRVDITCPDQCFSNGGS